MKFSDQEVMLYVDGAGEPDTAAKIELALKDDHKLQTRIQKFQLANTAMLLHVNKETQMPDALYSELKNKRILASRVSAKNKSFISKIISQAANTNFFTKGMIAASITAFGFFATFQSQMNQNNNIAKEFFTSFEQTDRLSKKRISSPSLEIALSNVNDYLTKPNLTRSETENRAPNGSIFFRSVKKEVKIENSKEVQTFDVELSNSKLSDYQTVLEVLPQGSEIYHVLPPDGLINMGAKIKVVFGSKYDGLLTRYYKKAKSNSFKRLDYQKPIAKGETLSYPAASISEGDLGTESLQFIFEKKILIPEGEESWEIFSNILQFTVIDPKNNFFTKASKNFAKVPKSLFSKKTIVKIGSLKIDKSFLDITNFSHSQNQSKQSSKKTSIWKNKENFLIDLTGDNYADIIAVDETGDSLPDYLSIDRNENKIIDAVLKISTSINGKLSYQWFLDENEDGRPDLIVNDSDGDGLIDQRYPI